MAISRFNIKHDVNAYHHNFVTVTFDNGETLNYYVGRNVSDWRALNLAEKLRGKYKLEKS